MTMALLSLPIRIQVKDSAFFGRCELAWTCSENMNVNVSFPSSRS